MFKFKKWKTNLTIFLLTFVMLSNTLLGDWNGVITVQAEETGNLLENGDFETVTGELSATAITSYTAPIATGATWLGCKKDVVATTGDDTTTILDMLYSIGAYAEEGYQDGYVLKIHKGNVAENVQVKRAWVRQENVALDATTTYVLSAQVKPVSVTSANDVSGNPQMQLIITDGTNAIGKKELDVTTSNNKDNRWNTVEVEFTTTAAVTKGQVQIGVRNVESGYWLIDNVVLTKKVTSEINLDKTEATLETNGTTDITATLTNIVGDITWSSSAESIATVTADTSDSTKATVSAVAAGTATITAKGKDSFNNDVTATCTVTVTAAPVVVESLSMTPEKQILYLNDSETLIVTITPEDAADKTLTWSSGNTEVATVTADTSDSTKATVTSVAVGETTVTATSANGKTATCVVTVKEAGLLPNGDFERKTGSISATEISTKKLIAGETAAWYGCNSGTYLTTDENKAIVDVLYSISTEEGYDGGNVLKIHKGNVDANAEVNRAWVRQELALEPNTTYTLSAQVKPVGMTTVNEVNSTKYPLIQLIVSDNGSAKSEHLVSTAEKDNIWKDLVLEFTTDDATNTSKTRVVINVYRLESGYCLIDNVVLTKVEPKITLATTTAVKKGETTTITADTTNIVGDITWSSSDETIMTVTASENDNKTAVVTGVAKGTATIIAKGKDSSGKEATATCTVTVTATGAEAIPNMFVNGEFEVATGSQTIEGKKSSVYLIDAASAWYVSNYWAGDTAKVQYSIDTVEGYAGGNVLKMSAAEGNSNINRAVTQQKVALKGGTTYIFKAKVKAVGVTGASDPRIELSYVENNTGQTNSGVKDAVVKATAASDWVEITGEFTPSGSGDYESYVRFNVYDLTSGSWLVDNASLTRKPKEPKAIITQNGAPLNSVEVEINKTVGLTAEMNDPDDVLGDETITFSWRSEDETVATVDETGLVTAVEIGETRIVATSTDGKYTAACEIIVTEESVAVESISVLSTLNLSAGSQKKMEVTFNPTEATDKTLTWTSDNSSVAAVDEEGTVTGLSTGTATITATTANGKIAVCTVNVSASNTFTATLETDFGTSLTGDLNDHVTNNTGATYKLFTAPTNGDMTVNEDGTYTYVPYITPDVAQDGFVVLVTAGDDSAIINGSIAIKSYIDSVNSKLVSGSNLLFSKEELEAVKIAVKTEGTFQNDIWNEYIPYLNLLLDSTPTPYSDSNSTAQDEWQRAEADKTVALLMAYLISGDTAYKEKCLEYAKVIVEYPYWGAHAGSMQADLAGGHNAFALSLVYDWLKGEMDTDLRNTILKRLYYSCQCFEVRWDDIEAYLQNHLWINSTGLAASIMAISLDAEYAVGVIKGDSDISISGNNTGNNTPDYDVDVTMNDFIANRNRWIAFVLDKIGTSYKWLPEDGVNHEGAGYAEYGTQWLLMVSLLLEHNLGIDTFTGNDYFANHSEYFLNVIYPANSISAMGSLIDYGDGTRTNWQGPSGHFRVLAARYQDETAQWIAKVMEDTDAVERDSYWMGLLWGDGSIEPKLNTDKSTLYYSEDMGIAVARSDWSGDESLLFMRSGLPLGKKAHPLLTLANNESHVDPDCNAIILYSNGDYLLKTGGYTWKMTGNHNTLLINGQGQIGEGTNYYVADEYANYDGYEPTMTIIDDADTYSYFVGDATEAYVPDMGLSKFQRNVVFLKEENVVLIVDDIKSTQQSELELRWFPESKNVIESYGIYSVYSPNNTMNFYPFNTMNGDSVTTKFTEVGVRDRNNNTNPEEAFVQTYTGFAWQNAVAFSWAENGMEKVQVKYEDGGTHEHKFEVNGKIYTLNVSNNTLTVAAGSLNQSNESDTDSALASILFNQDMLEGFNSTIFAQDVERFWKSEELIITPIPNSPTASAVIDWDGKCPGTVTITCTSADKTKETTYTLNLKNDKGLLGIASASSTPNTKGISETCSYDNYIQEVGDDKTWASQQLPSITYDMGSLVDITKIDVAFNKSRNRETYYDLMISEDGEKWTMVQEDATAELTSQELRLSEYLTIYEGEALRAQYVRFKLRGNTGKKDLDSAYNSIQEISFYGTVVQPTIILEGTDSSYTKGTSGATASIHCSGNLKDLIDVKMDGVVVDESNYTKEEGSTIITFKTNYLETLSIGEHTVTLSYTKGRMINTTLTIVADVTDDNSDINEEGDVEKEDNVNYDDDNTVLHDKGNTQSVAAPTGDYSCSGVFVLIMAVCCLSILIMTKRKMS